MNHRADDFSKHFWPMLRLARQINRTYLDANIALAGYMYTARPTLPPISLFTVYQHSCLVRQAFVAADIVSLSKPVKHRGLDYDYRKTYFYPHPLTPALSSSISFGRRPSRPVYYDRIIIITPLRVGFIIAMAIQTCRATARVRRQNHAVNEQPANEPLISACHRLLRGLFFPKIRRMRLIFIIITLATIAMSWHAGRLCAMSAYDIFKASVAQEMPSDAMAARDGGAFIYCHDSPISFLAWHDRAQRKAIFSL